MSMLISDSEAILRFTATFSQGDLMNDVARSLTCDEVDALAGMLRALGEPGSAERWLNAHAEGDDEGDQHYRAQASGYVVPIDPMDALGCDSCQ